VIVEKRFEMTARSHTNDGRFRRLRIMGIVKAHKTSSKITQLHVYEIQRQRSSERAPFGEGVHRAIRVDRAGSARARQRTSPAGRGRPGSSTVRQNARPERSTQFHSAGNGAGAANQPEHPGGQAPEWSTA
jgi:hypothetical protein